MSELVQEVSGAEFGDQRLAKRLGRIVDQLGRKPNLSIPAALDKRGEIEAAYRFFDNHKVSPQAIMAPHRKATQERIRQADVVLLVQDTTELDLTRPEQQVQGVGPLESESHLGVHHHPLIAFNGQGLCLGQVWSKTWARDRLEPGSRKDKNKQRKAQPLEEKESMRWVEGVRASREIAETCPQTQCISVADSEADIYELFTEPRECKSGQLHLLIRAAQDRALCDQTVLLFEAVRQTACIGQGTLDVSSRRPKIKLDRGKRLAARDARIAEIEIRATTVTLRPPKRRGRQLPSVTVNAVLIEEPQPPQGQVPIQWLLLTTLPIDTEEHIRLIVHYYTIRWQIEIYFRTLKSGCRIESRYFERLGRLLNCLQVYSIVTWRILYLCRLSRECPDLDCEVVFAPSEWKAVYVAVRGKAPPATPPTLNEIVRMVASLGGYIIRKSTNPGTQTLWIGLQRLHDLATAWNAYGPGGRISKN